MLVFFFLKFNFKKPLLEGLCRSNLSAEWAGLGSKDVCGGGVASPSNHRHTLLL